MADSCGSQEDTSSAPVRQGCRANSLAPIHRLPPELLDMVFKHAVTFAEVVKRFDWRCILTLTHVCQLWRTMVVAEAALWSHIYMRAGTRFYELFIERSSGVPLTIYTRLNLNEVALMDDVLYFHGRRVRAVHIDHQSDGEDRKLEDISILNRLFTSAPHLECFVLKAFLEVQVPDDELINWRLFAEDISPLKALRLHLLWLWEYLPANYFPNLTHLLLWCASSSNCHADQLLALLSRTPNLQYLQLISADIAVDPESDPDPALSLISLPHVRTASIHFTELESALFLLHHLDLPAECAVCINGGGSSLDLSDPADLPRPDVLDIPIPPLRVLDTATRMDLAAWLDGFLIAGHSAPRFSSGFLIEAVGVYGHWAWLADKVPAMLPLGNKILPPMLKHFARVRELCFLLLNTAHARGEPRGENENEDDDRALVTLFLGALLPTPTADSDSDADGVPCPNLKTLGLEAEFAHAEFPFSALEHTLAARHGAGHPVARFVYHPHTRKHDGARFVASFAPLAPFPFVDVVEYRGAADARACPFRSPRGPGGCWDASEAERYWTLPAQLMSYDWEPELTGVEAGPEEEDDGGH